eukprot:CAMPEP_0194270896 /NCGR_PEP_ID=MMETSP0169-20130528/4800_1 /TAXON_ID=218684 /ORGANISM="Corethron pennatum, Strain L29A3" /LENGTH=386 /DNA_ID=CAMNT_0039013105 /DNA_START=187 /DNA_END=1347 /DNA_ORIENTATION=+
MSSKSAGYPLPQTWWHNRSILSFLFLAAARFSAVTSVIRGSESENAHPKRYDPSPSANLVDVFPPRLRLKGSGAKGHTHVLRNRKTRRGNIHEPEDIIWGLPDENITPEFSYPPCDRSLSAKSRALIDAAVSSAVVDPSTLEDPSTPQARAAGWLLEDYVALDPCANGPSTAKATQRFVLATLYFSTGGDVFWRDTLGWLGTGDECLWGGVGCDDAGIAVKLDMDENSLTGPLPEELSRLTSLEVIALDSNSLSGSIPPIFSELTSLEIIDFDNNYLTGTLPDLIYDLSRLRVLDLNHNSLTGTVSDALANLTDLSFIQLHKNDFSGTVPGRIGELEELETMSLHENGFVGSVPPSVCYLEKLMRLTSDCAGTNPKVECACCTLCF